MTEPKPPLVLIVDDDPAHCLMLATLLEGWSYQTMQVGDGQKAVDYVRTYPVDFILMDVRMPVMDGIEATRRIRQFNKQVPLVMLTAYCSVPSAVEAVEAGASDYLTKPLDFIALRSVMERVLRERGNT